ncbi:MAG: CD1871A family CXXC motif-containing protein [Clostridium sp.]
MESIYNYSKYVLLLVSISFICIGILRQEQFIVLRKSLKICLECIGVG